MPKGVFGAVLRGSLALLLIVALLLGLRAASRGHTAYAAADSYNPSFCLGGWQNPKGASGEPSLPPDADASSFSLDNSSYLASDVSAQIFCGYFPVEAREKPPVSATVSFHWSFGTSASTPESAPDATTTKPDAAPASTPAPDATTTQPDAAPASDATTTQSDTAPAAGDATTTNTDTAPAPAQPAQMPDVPPVQIPAPDAPAPSSPQSFLEWLVPSAYAAEGDAPVSAFDLLEVSYSFDGVVWHAAGRVNATNWNNFSIQVPADSWENLQNLQIMVAALPSLGERPEIYLDSVSLNVQNDLTVTEVVMNGAQAVGDAVDSALAVTDSVTQAVADFFTPNSQTAAVADAAPQPPAPPAPVKKLSFSRRVELVNSSLHAPNISIGDNGTTLTVSGSCRKPYFVVLTYRKADDAEKNPRSFVSNYAGSCSGGSFSYDMSNLPVDTLPGDYYLVVAEQGEEGGWNQVSAPAPITISSVEVPAQ